MFERMLRERLPGLLGGRDIDEEELLALVRPWVAPGVALRAGAKTAPRASTTDQITLGTEAVARATLPKVACRSTRCGKTVWRLRSELLETD